MSGPISRTRSVACGDTDRGDPWLLLLFWLLKKEASFKGDIGDRLFFVTVKKVWRQEKSRCNEWARFDSEHGQMPLQIDFHEQRGSVAKNATNNTRACSTSAGSQHSRPLRALASLRHSPRSRFKQSIPDFTLSLHAYCRAYELKKAASTELGNCVNGVPLVVASPLNQAGPAAQCLRRSISSSPAQSLAMAVVDHTDRMCARRGTTNYTPKFPEDTIFQISNAPRGFCALLNSCRLSAYTREFFFFPRPLPKKNTKKIKRSRCTSKFRKRLPSFFHKTLF